MTVSDNYRITFSTILVFVCAVVVASACSDGDDNPAQNNELNTMDSASGTAGADAGMTAGADSSAATDGDVMQEPRPLPASLNTTNYRAWAIDALEVLDILVFHAARLPPELSAIEARGTGDCPEGGSASVGAAEGSGVIYRITMAACVLKSDWPSTNGTVELRESGDLLFDTFQSEDNSGRTTSVEGVIGLQGVQNASAFTSTNSSFQINDGQGDIVITDMQVEVNGTDEDTINLTAILSASFTRFASTAKVEVSSAEAPRDAPHCLSAGRLVIEVDDALLLSVEGQAGGNLLVTFADNSDTIACEELGTLVGGDSAGGPFPPPATPGG